MIYNKTDIINFFVFKNDEHFFFPKTSHMHPWTFFVHASIFKDFVNTLRGAAIIVDGELFEYELHIDGKWYDMCLITIPPGNNKNILFIRNAIRNSQVSFVWKDSPTLFIDKESFNILQDFIAENNLQPHILKINDQPSISASNGIITVVTFSQSLKPFNRIIEKYDKYLRILETHFSPHYYYLTYGFPWLQPQYLDHFKIELGDDFIGIILIILNHLGTINYADELSIFDLLSLRLALCDYRNPSNSTNLIKYEIDFMISRSIAKYITNSLLDLDKYFMVQNCLQREILIGYLIYEFQYLFDTVKHIQGLVPHSEFQETEARGIIELANESDLLNMLKLKNNINFEIVGRNYDEMSLSLLLDLIECRNVFKIHLDTNFTFNRDVCNLNRSVSNINGVIDLHFEGRSVSNYIENFITSLKTVTLLNGNISLNIYCNLMDYTIFDNLPNIFIYFNDMKITSNLLNDLLKCNLKSSVGCLNCTFENTCTNWALLDKLAEFEMIEILEDEGTWQSMFEFVSSELVKTNSKEFWFVKKEMIILGVVRPILLNGMTFMADELNSKLELRDKGNKTVDLYNLKFGLSPECDVDYDFYQ